VRPKLYGFTANMIVSQKGDLGISENQVSDALIAIHAD